MSISQKSLRNFLSRQPYQIGTVLAIVVYTVIVGQWAVNRYYSFNATLWDLGIMTQAIWNTGHGRILYESVNLGFPISRLMVAHWELIYLLLALIYRFIPSVPLLLCIQTFILASGAYPLYRLAFKKLGSATPAFLIAMSYLLYPALHGPNMFDLHSLTFATTFLLFMFYYIETNKVLPALICAILSLLCREDVAIVICLSGMFIMVFRKKYKLGLAFIVLSALILCAYLNRTAYVGHQEILESKNASSLWSHLGGDGGYLSIVSVVLKKPLHVIEYIFSYDNILFLIKLFFPVLGICFLAPSMLLICFPTLLLYLLSDWGPMHQIEYQYTSTLTPFIFLATVNGINRARSWFDERHFIRDRIVIILSISIFIASVIATLTYSILRYQGDWSPTQMNRITAAKLHDIPDSCSISTIASLGPHVANRQHLYHFPDNWDDADFLLIGLNRPKIEIKNYDSKLPTIKTKAWNQATMKAFADPNRDLMFEIDNVFCLMKRQDGEDAFFRYFFRDSVTIARRYRSKIHIEDDLTIRGIEPVYQSADQIHVIITFQNDRAYTVHDSLTYYLLIGDKLIPVDHRPQFGRYTMRDWPQGKMILDLLFIDKPAGATDIDFRLFLTTTAFPKEQIPIFSGSFE